MRYTLSTQILSAVNYIQDLSGTAAVLVIYMDLRRPSLSTAARSDLREI